MDNATRKREFPVDKASDMDAAAIRILHETMQAGRTPCNCCGRKVQLVAAGKCRPCHTADINGAAP